MLNYEKNELAATPVHRSLLIRPLVSTSTPAASNKCNIDENNNNNSNETQHYYKRPRRRWLRPELETLREPSESPIFCGRLLSKIEQESEPVFGRSTSVSSCRFSDTFIASSLEKMELYNNNTNNSNYNENKLPALTKDQIVEEPEASTSSFQANEQFKNEINKIKKRKSTTPKHRSPKICKVITCKQTFGSTSEKIKAKTLPESTKHHTKSPKNKNPSTYKIPRKSPKRKSPKASKIKNKSPNGAKARKIPITSTDSTNHTNSNNHKTLSSTSDKALINKCQSSSKTQSSGLTTSKCPRSPKLHTAARAAAKQYREEIRKEKEKQLEELKNRMLEEQKREEEKEILRLRQQTLFKAKPIRKYVPIPIIKKRPLTDPVSPTFCKRRRIDHSSGAASRTGNPSKAS